MLYTVKQGDTNFDLMRSNTLSNPIPTIFKRLPERAMGDLVTKTRSFLRDRLKISTADEKRKISLWREGV